MNGDERVAQWIRRQIIERLHGHGYLDRRPWNQSRGLPPHELDELECIIEDIARRGIERVKHTPHCPKR